MRVVGLRSVRIADLVLPGDIDARMKTAHANDLGADLEEHGGYVHEPVVRESDMRLIAGRDRVAGALAAGKRELLVKLVETDDDEAEELELLENFRRRRDDEQEMRARHLAILERKAAANLAERPKAPGRPPTPKSEARKELAAKLGVTPSALAMQERRAKEEPAWGDECEERMLQAEPPPPCIRDFGLGVPPNVESRAHRVQVALEQADSHLRALAKLVNAIEDTGLSGHDADKLKSEYQRFAFEVRGAVPESLCPWCKGRIEVERCMGCYGTGFATAAKLRADVPKELLREGEAAMVANGKGGFRRLGAPAPKRRTIIVTDADGNEREIEAE